MKMNYLISRRNVLLSLAALGVASRLPSLAEAAAAPTFKLPPLGYALDALEPYIDAATMKIHHDKHHAAYVKGLNDALAKHPGAHVSGDLAEMLEQISQLPASLQPALRNHGGGHWNHSFFWQILGPKSPPPSVQLRDAITKAFGSWKNFEEEFSKAALTRFGSGWAWLVVDKDGNLKVTSTANQDCPLMDKEIPVLGLDVWEHAYYLKYQNRRADYIKAFWNVVHWPEVERRLKAATA